MVFAILSCLFVKEIQIKVSPLASLKSLTKFEIHSSNPLQIGCKQGCKGARVQDSSKQKLRINFSPELGRLKI